MTSHVGRLAAPRSRLRLPRRTARLRLTLLYGCLFTLSGAGLLVFTYWLFGLAAAGAPMPELHDGQQAIDLHALAERSAIALAVMAALALVLGWLVAGRVLRPLRAITATARAMSATSLDQRLALAGPDDEFKQLADTLDDLLARLQASFTAQRHFVANASHELRTPLTLDQTLLELALCDRGATAARWHSTGQELLESSRQQQHLIEALLTLATSQAGLSHHQPVDLSEIAAGRLAAARGTTDSQRLRVETSLSPAPTRGDPDLIERLAANLLDNAIKYNVPGGTITLTTGNRGHDAVLSVANTGPAIPPAEIGRLFQPFQRLATGRTSNGGGHGLGLSIVAAIAQAHRATLTTHARPEGGLHIQVSFPAPKQSLPNSKFSSTGQRSPAARISRALLTRWPPGV
jgi:signal transduction histidine kinase